MESREFKAREHVVGLIQFIGDDPEREGLLETPSRVVKAHKEMFSGYDIVVSDLMKTFESGDYDGIVICKDIEFYSTCEHHMVPFYGRAHVGYIPDGKVIGLSKIARLVDAFAKRLQIQENMTKQIADAIHEGLSPKAVGVVVEGHHLCMMARGVQKQNSAMITSAMTGAFRTSDSARAEFLKLIGKGH